MRFERLLGYLPVVLLAHNLEELAWGRSVSVPMARRLPEPWRERSVVVGGMAVLTLLGIGLVGLTRRRPTPGRMLACRTGVLALTLNGFGHLAVALRGGAGSLQELRPPWYWFCLTGWLVLLR